MTGELQRLLAEAYGELTPLMGQVNDLLQNSGRSAEFVHQDAGQQLFAASVVLRFRPQQIGQLIIDHGIDAVAEAFRQQFGRPIIESEQIQQYADPSGAGSWAAFYEWTQLLWNTVEREPAFTGNVDHLVGEVFNHDKGYNRAVNFAQAPAVAAIVEAPSLASALEVPAPAPNDAGECGMWIYRGLEKARLVATGQAISWTDFDTAARANWSIIAAALGDATLDPAAVLTDDMKDELTSYSVLS